MMRLVRILALIVPEGVQPLLEILLLSDLSFGMHHGLLHWRLMPVEISVF
jgi:hypothetical protein